MKNNGISIFILATALCAAPLAYGHDHDEDDNGEPFDEGRLFFELNDTDGDLGIHGKVDGDEWKSLQIEDPYDRKMMQVKIKGRLKQQGLTEIFFESAEPTFDELDPDDFFVRFPEGEYDIEGKTLDGEERENEVYLSHVIPAAPDGITINGEDAPEDCDSELPAVDPTGGVVISWDPVTMSHAAKHGDDGLGVDGVIDVRYYEIVVEVDDTDFKSVAMLPSTLNSWTVPEAFFSLSDEDEYKFEILVRINVYDDDGEPVMIEVDDEEQPLPGNKSAVESCFAVE